MAIRIVEENCRVEGREGLICLESDAPPQEGYAELTGPEARQMAKDEIIRLGISVPALDGIARPYAVDETGQVLSPTTQKPAQQFRYRIDYRFYRAF